MWRDRAVLVSCDNQSAVRVCQSGKTKDPFLEMCFHALWLQAAALNVDLRVIHIPGKINTVADALSRHKYQGPPLRFWEAVMHDVSHFLL